MAKHRQIDYWYGNLIFQLRLAQLILLPIHILVLAIEVEKFISGSFLFPLLFSCFAGYMIFWRCYESIDGRYDYRSMLNSPELMTKLEYAADLFLPSVFLIAAHFTSPQLNSNFTALVFKATDYLVLICSLGTAYVECSEGHKLKYM